MSTPSKRSKSNSELQLKKRIDVHDSEQNKIDLNNKYTEDIQNNLQVELKNHKDLNKGERYYYYNLLASI